MQPMWRTSQARTIRPMERGFHWRAGAASTRAVWGSIWITFLGSVWILLLRRKAGKQQRRNTVYLSLCSGSDKRLGVERAVGDEGFAGGLFQDDLALAEQAVDIVAPLQRYEEDFAWAAAPLGGKFGRSQEQRLRIGKG